MRFEQARFKPPHYGHFQPNYYHHHGSSKDPISMVQCTLKGGTQSPEFKASKYMLKYHSTVNFNNKAQDIRKVYGYTYNLGYNQMALVSVNFRDQNNKELFKYDQYNHGAVQNRIRELV